MSSRPLIALVGNPNTGKTTLFNRLTGQNARVGNYPGITVDLREGHAATPAGGGRVLAAASLPDTCSTSRLVSLQLEETS